MAKNSVRKSGASRTARPGAWKRRLPFLVGAAALVVSVLVALLFWPGASGRTARAYALAPESVLSAEIRRAPAKVREAYRFAVANRATLGYIPCFCGCGAAGHRSNADCYVRDIRRDGVVVFDDMSLG